MNATTGVDTLALLKSSQSNEWYTPAEHVSLVYAVMGDIDLDPASSLQADKAVIGAAKIFTEADGDLSWRKDGNQWHGKVYCNPPYGGLAGKFAAKALHEIEAGRVTEAILCLSGYAYETKWFRPILTNTTIPICWVHGRVKFTKPNGESAASTVGTIYVYLGPNVASFTEHFSKIGAIR